MQTSSTEAERRNRSGVEKTGGGSWTPDGQIIGLRLGTGCIPIRILYDYNYLSILNHMAFFSYNGDSVLTALALVQV